MLCNWFVFSLRPYLSLLYVEGGEDRSSDGGKSAVRRGTIRWAEEAYGECLFVHTGLGMFSHRQ